MTPQYFFFDTYIGYFLQVLPIVLLAGLLYGLRGTKLLPSPGSSVPLCSCATSQAFCA